MHTSPPDRIRRDLGSLVPLVICFMLHGLRNPCSMMYILQTLCPVPG